MAKDLEGRDMPERYIPIKVSGILERPSTHPPGYYAYSNFQNANVPVGWRSLRLTEICLHVRIDEKFEMFLRK